MKWLRNKIARWLAPAFERLLPTLQIKEREVSWHDGAVHYADGYMPDTREEATENPFTRKAIVYAEGGGDRED